MNIQLAIALVVIAVLASVFIAAFLLSRIKQDLQKVSENESGLSRRKFLTRALGVMPAIIAPEILVGLVSALWPSGNAGGFGSLVNVTTPLAEIRASLRDEKAPFYVPDARAYLIDYPIEDPAAAESANKIDNYVANEGVKQGLDEGLFALYQKCPHLGCRVPWCGSSQWFECPCHGSKFNKAGEKKAGPTPRGMDRFPVVIKGDKITIDTRTVILGPPQGTDTTRQGAEGPACV